MSKTISEIGKLYLRWALTEGVGPLLFARILVQFGGVEQALGANAAQLAQIRRIGSKLAERIARSRDQADLDAEIRAAEQRGVRIVSPADAEYPPGLRNIPDPPIVLYVRGELRRDDALAVAVVGTRRCSIYGGEQARRFGELLAGAGFTVISGLARGVDAFAHHGALDAGGRSIAVMGRDLTEIYPPENAALAQRLLERGAWISELPMGTPVSKGAFPSRNRIIAGMSLGTLVVEAPRRSGALITARLASEYNREVFAVPGRAQDPSSAGTNELIKRGYAKLTTCLEDILEELGEVGDLMAPEARQSDAQPAPADSARSPVQRSATLSEIERRVLDSVPFEPILQDVVLRAGELPPGDVLAALTALELKGFVKRLPGQMIARIGQA